MKKGYIKFVKKEEGRTGGSGYGFIIELDENDEEMGELFFHRSYVIGCDFDDLEKNQYVEYTDGTDRKTGRPIAINVTPIQQDVEM